MVGEDIVLDDVERREDERAVELGVDDGHGQRDGGERHLWYGQPRKCAGFEQHPAGSQLFRGVLWYALADGG